MTFKTVSQSQITYTVLVETLSPAQFLTYERLKCLAVKGVERRGNGGARLAMPKPRGAKVSPPPAIIICQVYLLGPSLVDCGQLLRGREGK